MRKAGCIEFTLTNASSLARGPNKFCALLSRQNKRETGSASRDLDGHQTRKQLLLLLLLLSLYLLLLLASLGLLFGLKLTEENQLQSSTLAKAGERMKEDHCWATFQRVWNTPVMMERDQEDEERRRSRVNRRCCGINKKHKNFV